MTMFTRPFIGILAAGLLTTGLMQSARQEASLPPLALPAGFQAEVFAEKMENARHGDRPAG